jgi:hypothetical protein
MEMMKQYYWIAVNGASVALCSVPAPKAVCSPVPEQLFGFSTLEEAKEVQNVLLTAPIPHVEERMASWADRIGQDMAYERPANPEPPCEGTMWLLHEMLGEEQHLASGRAFVKRTGERDFLCVEIQAESTSHWLEAAMRFAKDAPLGERIEIDHNRANEHGRKAILQVCGDRTYLCGFTKVEKA